MFAQTVQDRLEIIERFVRGGAVLDVGCVDSRPGRDATTQRLERKPNLLFKRIVELNPQTLGVDIDAEGVEALKGMGYQAVCADATVMELERRFDAIVAGELIEHLENPGLFLRNMRRHLAERGVLILSTPNPFYQGQTWKIWRYGRPMVHEDHTHWQDPATLCHLLKRTGLELAEGYWVQPDRGVWKTWKRFFRPYFAHGFMVVARAC